MLHDVRFYRRLGVTAMGSFTGFDKLAFPTPLRLWAWMKLWTDPDLDLESLKRDFYSRYFGPDAPAVRAYCEDLERLMFRTVDAANLTATGRNSSAGKRIS